jgi:hypothetical protein
MNIGGLIVKLTLLEGTTTDTLIRATNDFINSNKRNDRDKVIKLKARLDTYNDILKLLKDE